MSDRLRKVLDRLVEDGTLSAEQADKVGEALRSAGVVAPSDEAQAGVDATTTRPGAAAADTTKAGAGAAGAAPSDTTPGPSGAAAGGEPTTTGGRVGELLSYVGGALVVGALTLILGLSWDELGKAQKLLICGTATLLLIGAALLVGRLGETGRRQRTAASALAALGAVGAAVTAGVATPSSRLLPGVVLLAVGVAGYVLWKGVALQPAMYAGGLVIVVNLLDRLPASPRTSALFILAYGVVWLLLEQVVRDRWMAGVLGSLTLFVGAEIGAFDRYPVLGLVYGVLVIGALFTLFWRRRAWAYAIFGVLTALVVPATALGRIWDNALIGAAVLLAVGAALVIAAVIVAVRGRRR